MNHPVKQFEISSPRLQALVLALAALAGAAACAAKPRGPLAYVTNEIGRTLVVVDTSTHEVLRTVPVRNSETGVKPMGVVVSPDGRRVYVATGRGNPVDVFDTNTFKLLARVPTGQRPGV